MCVHISAGACLCVGVCTLIQVPMEARGVINAGDVAAGSCELPSVGGRNRVWVL